MKNTNQNVKKTKTFSILIGVGAFLLIGVCLIMLYQRSSLSPNLPDSSITTGTASIPNQPSPPIVNTDPLLDIDSETSALPKSGGKPSGEHITPDEEIIITTPKAIMDGSVDRFDYSDLLRLNDIETMLISLEKRHGECLESLKKDPNDKMLQDELKKITASMSELRIKREKITHGDF